MSEPNKDKFIEFEQVKKKLSQNTLFSVCVALLFLVAVFLLLGYVSVNNQMKELSSAVKASIEGGTELSDKLDEEDDDEKEDAVDEVIKKSKKVDSKAEEIKKDVESVVIPVEKKKIKKKNKLVEEKHENGEDEPIDEEEVFQELIPRIEPKTCSKLVSLISELYLLREQIELGKDASKNFAKIVVELEGKEKIDKHLKMIEWLTSNRLKTIPQLIEEFDAVERLMITRSRIDLKRNRILNDIIFYFSKFVFVKKVGERAEKAGGVEALVQNIGDLMTKGEIEQAMDLAANSKYSHDKLTQEWIKDANHIWAVQNAIEELLEFSTHKLNCDLSIKRSEEQ